MARCHQPSPTGWLCTDRDDRERRAKDRRASDGDVAAVGFGGDPSTLSHTPAWSMLKRPNG